MQIDNEIVLITAIHGATITVKRAQSPVQPPHCTVQGRLVFAAIPTPNQWTITGPDVGNLDSQFTFNNFENLTGGRGADTFSLLPAGSVSGTINGGPIPPGAMGGLDWLDYSSRLTPVTVNLAAGTATNVGVVVNVQNVHGGNAVNTLTGDDTGNASRSAERRDRHDYRRAADPAIC